jgi:signal transduction histidine kinase
MFDRLILASYIRHFQQLLLLSGITGIFACHSSVPEKQDHSPQVDRIMDSAAVMLVSGNIRQAMQYVDEAYGALPATGIGDTYRKYDLKRNYYLAEKNYEAAMIYADSALRLLEDKAVQKKYYKEYIDANLHKGDILVAQKHYYKAFQYYYTSKVAIESTEDSCAYKVAVGNFSGRLGTVSYKQAKYAEAVAWYKESVDRLYQCEKGFKLFAATQGMLDNIGLGYTRLKMGDSALLYYHKALDFITANERRYPGDTQYIAMARGIIYGNEGDAWLLKGDTARASALYKQSIAINSRKGYYNGDAYITRLKLAVVLLAQSELPKMNSILQEVEANIKEMPYDEARALLLKLRLLYYSKQGQVAQSHRYLEQFLLLKDSIDLSNRELAGADFNREFQSLKREYQLTFLGEKDKRNTIYLLLAIIVACMITALSLMIYYSLRQSKKNEQRINLQNEQLEATSEDLAESNRDYARIMKIVAHDLKNPLGAINGICSFLLARSTSPANEKEMLELIRSSSQHSIEIINDLLEVNFNQERKELKVEEVDLGLLLHQCIDLLRFKAKNKHQQIIVKAETEVMVKADYDKIWRVVNNLVVNAIKFSLVGKKIHVFLDRMGDYVQVCVQDTGMGIPEELKDKVFDMFTEAKRAGTSGEQPYGLGLCINKQLVEAHGGKIWFESIQEVGTSFYFTLPYQD